MTIIPAKPVTLEARTDADFSQEFVIYEDAAQTTPMDLTGWTFRFVAKRDELDPSTWFVIEGAGITVVAAQGKVTAFADKAVLVTALGAEVKRFHGKWALQGTGPGGLDAVWAAGDFVLTRGL